MLGKVSLSALQAALVLQAAWRTARRFCGFGGLGAAKIGFATFRSDCFGSMSARTRIRALPKSRNVQTGNDWRTRS